jgi:hypothetical protein
MSAKKTSKPKTLKQLERALHSAGVTLSVAETRASRARNVESRAAGAYRKAQAALLERLAAIQAGKDVPNE